MPIGDPKIPKVDDAPGEPSGDAAKKKDDARETPPSDERPVRKRDDNAVS